MGDGSGTSGGAPAALRLLADLRSRSNTRHAATLLLLPRGAVETAAMALDLGAGDVATGPLAPEELAARVEALLQRKAQADRRRERVRLGLQAADRDALTGLHNRRYAEPMLERMAARARHDGRDLAVMMLDIDHFKRINDTWGHAAGDRILQAVARRLRDASRPGDLLARVGGEEFLIAMPDTTADAARTAAERLRHAVAGRPFALGPAEAREGREAMSRPAGQAAWATSATGEARLPETRPSEPGCAEVRVTVSIGVAVGAGTLPGTRLGGSLACPDLFERADGALYAAKTAGRNMVAMARSAA
jgi:two-component system cell cycle response regulator